MRTLPNDLPVRDAGDPGARTALVLHGGGGPMTVAPVVAHLGRTMHVLAPTHPGWDGTPHVEGIDTMADLAAAYLERLVGQGERGVVLVGSSIGGWIALEMALQAATDDRFTGTLDALVLVDAFGAEVAGQPVVDFFALDARGLAQAAWHDPERGYRDPATLTDQERAVQQSNGAAMARLGGPTVSDPTLLGRLSAITEPTLVVWGASDRMVTPDTGRAVAAAIPGAEYHEVAAAGHLPHLEAPDATWAAIDPFLAAPN